MKKAVIIFIAVLLVLSGCYRYVQISDIDTEPQKYVNKQVMVRGRVIETFALPFLNKGMYQIDDSTGKIWIVSQKTVPFRGDKVTVKGEVKTAVTINNKAFGKVIVESE